MGMAGEIFFTRTEYTVEAACEWDQAKLDQEIDGLRCVTQEMTAPSDASLVIDESGVHLTEAVKGNTIKKGSAEKGDCGYLGRRKAGNQSGCVGML